MNTLFHVIHIFRKGLCFFSWFQQLNQTNQWWRSPPWGLMAVRYFPEQRHWQHTQQSESGLWLSSLSDLQQNRWDLVLSGIKKKKKLDLYLYLFTDDLSIITWSHQLRVGGPQTIFGRTCDSITFDWSLSRSPAHLDRIITHIHDLHARWGHSIYNPGQ